MKLADKIVGIAKAQVGYHEGRDPDGNWNNKEKYAAAVPGLAWADGQPWCAVFVSWCALQAGMSDLYPRTASCDQAGTWFKDRKQWNSYPAIGAQVFFGKPTDLTHTGIVCDFDDTYIWSVEGNTNQNGSAQGDGVYINKRPRRASNVVGYGYPKFPDGITSADPARKINGTPLPNPPAHESTVARLARIAAQRLEKIRNLRKRLRNK